jgi:hypothetical protein
MAYIREIARSLYHLKSRLEELEQAWESVPPGEKRDELEQELRKIRLEYEKVKNIWLFPDHRSPPSVTMNAGISATWLGY